MTAPTPATLTRLLHDPYIWLATVRADTRPHLVPLWFVWADEHIFLCVQPSSVKARNILANPQVSLALDHGESPVVLEGTALARELPWPPAAIAGFQQKYDWDITTDREYTLLLAVTPQRWLFGAA